jgi:uncharacterized zinc-type alcohol dehydrogenase-like protein
MPTIAYAVQSPASALAPILFNRAAMGESDVSIDILYCGVCHTDLHAARGDWPDVRYPLVPGHEIVGRVNAVGRSVSRFKVGDIVGVGFMIGSCKRCAPCHVGAEQYCERGFTKTFGGNVLGGGENTYGGYATDIVVDQSFVLAVRHDHTQLAAAAPLLCAGITVWSPLRHWNIGYGNSVGVIGIGGVGHMGVKLAAALGARVVAFTTSEAKRNDALALGAHEVVVSQQPEEMAGQANSLDLILDTVAAPHDLNQYLQLLRRDGTLVLLGLSPQPHPSPAVPLLAIKRAAIAGSAIGSIAETQDMLNFCAEKRIVATTETIHMQDVEAAFDRMLRGDVKYRFVIDMASLKNGVVP